MRALRHGLPKANLHTQAGQRCSGRPGEAFREGREQSWTCFDEPLPARSVVLFPHPLGSPDNRWSRRLGAQRGWWRALRDHSAFTRHSAGTTSAGAGSFCARPMRASAQSPRQIALEALR